MAAAEKATTTLSTKGQVILPKTIRQKRHWEAGTKLTVEDTPDGVLLKAAPFFLPRGPKMYLVHFDTRDGRKQLRKWTRESRLK